MGWKKKFLKTRLGRCPLVFFFFYMLPTASSMLKTLKYWKNIWK